jgi:hypothetical protein
MLKLLSAENKYFPSVVLVKPVLPFTRKCEGGKRESIISVILDVFNRESILGPVRMDPRLKLAGMTEGEMDTRHKLRV